MDKYEQHLQFLFKVFPNQNRDLCHEVFLNTAKRDLCKALFYLLQPQSSLEELLDQLEASNSSQVDLQIELLDSIVHWYCPNPSFRKIVGQAAKGLPIKIDSASIDRLKKFRRLPRKEMLQRWFQLVANSQETVLLQFLKRLIGYGHALEPCWATIDWYAQSKHQEISKAALNLLATMPNGIQKSIGTLTQHLRHPKMRFYALSAMQQSRAIPPQLLKSLLDPIFREYRTLMNQQGQINDLWQEFRLAQNIAQNNGLVWSIPDISLGRF